MTTCIALGTMLGTALVGTLASTIFHDFHATFLGLSFGPIDTIIAIGGICAFLAAIYAMINLRGIRL